MDKQTKRTMLKVRVSDDFLIFRTVSRARKSSELYVQRDALSPLTEGKRVVLNEYSHFCVMTPIERDNAICMEFYWTDVHYDYCVSGWKQTLTIPREKFLDFVERSAAEDGPKEWKALSMDEVRYPRLIFRKCRSLEQVMGNPLVRRKLTKFLRDNFHWLNTDEIVFSSDFVPYSFFFREYRRGKDGWEEGMCGGLILHNQEDMRKAYYSTHT